MASASKPHLSRALLDQYDLISGTLVDETGLAQIWRVVRKDQSIACLKLYHGSNMRNERPGFDLLSAVNGQGATRIYKINDNSALMEWLDGPSLGDMARAGDDQQAAYLLVNNACDLHKHFPQSVSEIKGLQRLDEPWF